jgi:hypothetical protein
MAKIFVVFGQTGEYSDRQEWLVSAYESKVEAQSCVDRCNAYAKTEPTEGDSAAPWQDRYEKKRAWLAANPDDTSMSCDYTGTEYGLYEIELVTSEDTR